VNHTEHTAHWQRGGSRVATIVLAVALALMTIAAIDVALDVRAGSEAIVRAGGLQQGVRLSGLAGHPRLMLAAMWALPVGQMLLGGILVWTLLRSSRRSRARLVRQAEQSQALLERLSIATQAAGVYCWELDWKTYAITWDASRLPPEEAAAASRRHFGAELGSDLFKWVHPDDQHAGGKAMTESLARGEDHVSFRYRIVLPDHSIRHVQAFARTYCDAEGKPQRSLGVSWDVTAEVEAAEKVARNAAYERELLERMSVATQAAGLQCWEFDFKSKKVTWLDYGADPEDALESIQAAGDAMLETVLPEDHERVRELAHGAVLRHEPMMSTRYRRRAPDGTIRHMQMYQRFFYDEHGEGLRALGANIDITESFERQAQVEAISIRFSIATRAAKAGVWEFQELSGDSWWDETMYVIYGCSPETFQPTLATVSAMIHPEDLPVAEAAWANAFQESGQLHVQFRIVRPSGDVSHVDTLAVVVTDPLTSNRRLVGITLDVSERVEAEQRERRLQKQLREASHQSGMAEVATGVLHNVGNVLNSLGIAASTAHARLKASQFDRLERVAGILESHRGSLANFLENDPRGQRLPDYVGALGVQFKSDAHAIQQEMDAISSHIAYLREIVQAQQSFARVGGAQDTVDVRELVETALTLKAQELNGAQITRDIADLPHLLTDRYKLLQIIVNFVTNACDAMAANKPTAPRLTIHARLVLGQLEIAVDDTGVGIPADLLPRIWEFGFTTKPQGHGFGLHSAAVAAQQLGGTIAARSDGQGLGASFCVKIPLRLAPGVDREAAA
jgi:signal transduction histidine kinase